MKKILILIIFFALPVFSQQIKQGVFTNGAVVSSNANFNVSSNLGQLFTGVSTSPDFIVNTGFYYGVSLIVSVDEEEVLPIEFKLEQNFPNPFNPVTVIKFSVPHFEHVAINVYDITGSNVATLVNKQMDAGNYTLTVDASFLASGVYIYRITAGNFVATKKMMLLK